MEKDVEKYLVTQKAMETLGIFLPIEGTLHKIPRLEISEMEMRD